MILRLLYVLSGLLVANPASATGGNLDLICSVEMMTPEPIFNGAKIGSEFRLFMQFEKGAGPSIMYVPGQPHRYFEAELTATLLSLKPPLGSIAPALWGQSVLAKRTTDRTLKLHLRSADHSRHALLRCR